MMRISAILILALAITSGVSCAVAPSTGPDSTAAPGEPVQRAGAKDLTSAYEHFERRDFAAAAQAYERVISGTKVQPQNRRLAYVGKALVHLSTDDQWRDLDEAARLLQAAESMDTGAGDFESGMLMTTLSALIGAEKNNSELNTKVSNSAAEIARLKEDREALQAEQAALNEALEKLKKLTIGN